MKFYFRFFVSTTLLFLMCLSIYATPDVTGKKKETKGDVGNTITLVTSGNGDTKEEATKNALRSALEQTYGAFVSSNSQVVNDELVKDEIVSISTGNIVSYEELSFIDSNPKQVTVKSVVSITRLQNYAQNKGMSAELAGNTFAMNLKMEELNKKNQDIALKHLVEQTRLMSLNLFDYELSVGDPEKTSNGVQVPLTIQIKANNNTLAYYDYFHKTLTSIAVQKKTGRDVHRYGAQGIEIEGLEQFDGNAIVYDLRGEAHDSETYNTIFELFSTLGSAVLNCEIVDNLGNVSGFKKESNYNNITRDYVATNKLSCSRQLSGYRYDFKSKREISFPIQYLTSSGASSVYFWMNAAKPKAGEKLYETKMYLNYSIDEISRVSKIDIVPIAFGRSTSFQKSNMDVKSLYEKWDAAAACVDIYNDENKSVEERINALKTAYSLFKSIESTPEYENVINPNSLKKHIDQLESVLKKNHML